MKLRPKTTSILLSAFLALLFTNPLLADFFSPGEPNGWDNTTPMTENPPASGIWEYNFSGGGDADNRVLFDILSESGNWDSKVWPAGNQWVTPAPLDGGPDVLILDTNSYSDGWFPAANRVKVVSESQANWTAVGDWQDENGGSFDFNNSDPLTAMSAEGGGIYSYETTLPANDYVYKAVVTGTWDAIGGASRNVNSDNFPFSVPAGTTSTKFFVNVFDGTVKVENIPEPATLGMFGLAAASLLFLRRRKGKRS